MIKQCSWCKEEKEIKSVGIACGPQGGFIGTCSECSKKLFDELFEDEKHDF